MSASSALAASTGGGRLSPGRLPNMDIAPAGQTDRQCWHFQQPFQPKESKPAMRGAALQAQHRAGTHLDAQPAGGAFVFVHFKFGFVHAGVHLLAACC